MTHEGQSFEGVGVRFKGSIGSLRYCLEEDGSYKKPSFWTGSGCRKLSIKIDSDKFMDKKSDRKKKIMGQKKFLFHGMVHQPGLSKEVLMYRLYRDAGVQAPLATYATLSINGEYHGYGPQATHACARTTHTSFTCTHTGSIYALVQNIDDEFTEQHFAGDDDGGKGNLYKER